MICLCCLERAHGCLGAWECGPVVPGPPPLGSWGTSQGLPGGGPGSKLQGPIPCLDPKIRTKIYVDFDVDFWSFWGRSWAPLGGHFRSCWRPFRAKLVPEPSSNRLIFEKVIFHETLRFPLVFNQNTSRWGQDRPKIAPRRVQDRLGWLFCLLIFRFDF